MNRHIGKLVRVTSVGLIVAAMLLGSSGRGQQGTSASQPMGGSASQGSSTGLSSKSASQLPKLDPDGPDPLNSRMEEQQSKSRNADRQRRLQSDTEKLLSLATELKEQVDKTNKNILSVEVIKKADEIEKLAKSVKDRMKG